MPGWDAKRGKDSSYLSRRQFPGLKYYFIDFGHSVRYQSPDEPLERDCVRGQYADAPEYDLNRPFNPFPLDIWCVGFMIKEDWLDVRGRIYIFFSRKCSRLMFRRNTPKWSSCVRLSSR
jgi:hypothetical protein